MTPGADAEDRPGEPAEDDGEVVPSTDDEPETEPRWVRRRRLDAVFGDGVHGQALGDRYYRDQVPPHHG